MNDSDSSCNSSDQNFAESGVSVIIPCFNGERFLSEAIDSALEQTHSDLEVIVVDDGSTDASRKIANGYGDRIRYVFQQNGGLSAARNTGIRVATRSLVSFLDADDRLAPEMLETMVRELNGLPQGFVLVACHPETIDADGKLVAVRDAKALTGGEVKIEDLIQKSRFPCNVVVRRDVFFECGFFDTELKSSEDRDMWIRITSKYRIHLVPRKLAQIRRHGENMSKNATRQSRSIRRVLRKAYSLGAVPRWHVPFWCRAWAIYFYQSGFMFAEAGDNLNGARQLICSIFLWPCFFRLAPLGQPPFFRIRRILRILLEWGAPALMQWRHRNRKTRSNSEMLRSDSLARRSAK